LRSQVLSVGLPQRIFVTVYRHGGTSAVWPIVMVCPIEPFSGGPFSRLG
jgi:hypothetical protein